MENQNTESNPTIQVPTPSTATPTPNSTLAQTPVNPTEPPQHNRSKRWWLLALIIIIVIVALYRALPDKNTPAKTTTDKQVTDWITYHDTLTPLTLSYPPDWQVVDRQLLSPGLDPSAPYLNYSKTDTGLMSNKIVVAPGTAIISFQDLSNTAYAPNPVPETYDQIPAEVRDQYQIAPDATQAEILANVIYTDQFKNNTAPTLPANEWSTHSLGGYIETENGLTVPFITVKSNNAGGDNVNFIKEYFFVKDNIPYSAKISAVSNGDDQSVLSSTDQIIKTISVQ